VSRQKAHGGLGHRFYGVPVATCDRDGCAETRTWGPPITPTHAFTQIGGGAVWYGDTLGVDPYAHLMEPGRYADEGEADPFGNPFK
jgi:hypothetical protein